ncbi:hypothetical protein ABTD14_20135, partial [Acinetobacter baumannii]
PTHGLQLAGAAPAPQRRAGYPAPETRQRSVPPAWPCWFANDLSPTSAGQSGPSLLPICGKPPATCSRQGRGNPQRRP